VLSLAIFAGINEKGSLSALRWAQILSENLSREEDIMIAPEAMIGRQMIAFGG
jgi:hypothetical protein